MDKKTLKKYEENFVKHAAEFGIDPRLLLSKISSKEGKYYVIRGLKDHTAKRGFILSVDRQDDLYVTCSAKLIKACVDSGRIVRVVNAYKVADKLASLMGTLYDRWQDEKEYEDFEMYKVYMVQAAQKLRVKFVKATQRPFGFDFDNGERLYRLTVNAKSITLICIN